MGRSSTTRDEAPAFDTLFYRPQAPRHGLTMITGKGRFACLAALAMLTAGLAGCATPQGPGAQENACAENLDEDDAMSEQTAADAEEEALEDTLTAPTSNLPQHGGDPIRIGTLLPLTGSLQAFGGDMQRAVELAVKDVNANGGVMGRNLEVVQGDSQTDSSQAPQEFQRLLDEGVDGVVGAASSGVTNSVLNTAVENDMVLITPASTSPTLTAQDNNKLFFRVPPNDVLQGKVMADLLEQDGVDSVSTLFVNNDYGQGLSDQLVEEFDGTVDSTVSFDEDASQFSGEVTQLAQAESEAIVAVMYPGNGVPIMSEAFSQGLTETSKFYFSEGVFSGDFVQQVGNDSAGNSIVAGCKGTTPQALLDTGPESFQQKFEDEYGDPPGLFAAQSYDATIAIALGMAYSGSATPNEYKRGMETIWSSPGENVSDVGEALRLAHTGTDIDWAGPSGDFDWNERHDPVKGLYGIWQVTEDGELDVLEDGIEAELE